ncbi:hypothetical protein SUGI_0706240 [Cryptomeria japonica]|uniref:protein argonaute 3-like n=1 Tax=Cryptomeria japonica TaxID=3369 RepID=UPI002414A1D0|nr:protein argonaute 3-like [Cryptomeria japonica]GLJ35094.1 hypothetical protein SUGI_0706240 [Cryptomeria japonica]
MDGRGNSRQGEPWNARGKQKWEPLQSGQGSARERAREIDLLVNHFKVKFVPNKEIIQYKVDIIGAPSQGVSGSRTNMSMAVKKYIMNKFIEDNLRNKSLMYDGTDNLYSPMELEQEDFIVEPSRGKKYRVKLERVASSSVTEFLGNESGHVTVKQEFLQKLDAAVKEHLRRNYIIVGQGFYKNPSCLDYGTVAENGFSMSLRRTAQGLNLIVDYSITAFYVEIPVLKYLEANGIRMPLDVERALKGLQVTVKNRQPGQKFTVVGLTKHVTKEIKFNTDEGGEDTSIVDYYKKLPCLELIKKPGEQNFVQMEFCQICEGQRVVEDNLNSEHEKALKRVVSLPERREKIVQIIKSEQGPSGGGPYLAGFEMTLHPEMTQVTGRVLDAPVLMLGNKKGTKKKLTPGNDKRQWNMTRENKKTVFDGKILNNWGIIHFSKIPNKQMDVVNKFRDKIVRRFIEVGINVKQKPVIFEDVEEDILNNVVKLKKELQKIHSERNNELEILICIVDSSKHPGFKNLKFICEIEIGLTTQCCLFHQSVKKCANLYHRNDPCFKKNQNFASQYLTNFALEVNVKLGGSNVALLQSHSNQIPCIDDSDVVYFGADVNHPRNHDQEFPSIAAVVMSINWPDSNRYVFRIQRQKHRQEMISKLGDMCKELLQEYKETNNKRLPKNVIFFRNGIGDWQFDEVRKKELEALKDAFMELETDYNPKLTFIIAQKRHHTRLFRKSGDQNVPSGTVVDSAEIVYPSEINFYLCSHHNELGTSKVTHYYVLCNEIGFSSEKLQTLIYHLCFTSATRTKPVSIVPPVYYADLAACRGRLYVEALKGLSSSDSDSSLSNCNSSFNILLRGEKSMFFI